MVATYDLSLLGGVKGKKKRKEAQEGGSNASAQVVRAPEVAVSGKSSKIPAQKMKIPNSRIPRK